jgi:long-chain fatty acid transport protein
VEQRSVWPGGFGIPAGSAIELNGTDTTAGFNVSLLYTPYRNADGKPLVNIGLVYRSQATLHLTGEFRANGALVADAAATFVLPQVYSAGLAVWPVRSSDHEWKLELDVDYVGWKSVRNLDVHLSNGAVIPNPQNWQNAYNVMIGTEYKWLRLDSMPDWEMALRAGYLTQQTQVPDRTFNPGIPSAMSHVPSIGIGLVCKENGWLWRIKCGSLGIGPVKPKLIGLDVAYQAAFYEIRTISGNRNPTVDGRYDTFIHHGAISLRFNY